MSDTTSDFIYRGHTSAELIDALQRWIRAQGPDLAATTVTGFHHPDHAGFSNVTVTLDLDVRAQPDDTPQADRVAVRLLNEHPFYEGMDLRRQFDHQIRLRDEAGLPVPEMRWFGTDDPALGPQFFAMSFVDGDIPSDIPSYHQEPWLLALTTPEREQLWQVESEMCQRRQNSVMLRDRYGWSKLCTSSMFSTRDVARAMSV